MSMRPDRRGTLATLAAMALSALLLATPATAATKARQKVDEARYTAENLGKAPELEWVRNNIGRAKGILIVPELTKGGAFLVGGSNGAGVLLARNEKTGIWTYPAFYRMSSFNFGPQIGGQVAEIVLLIMTQNGLDSLLTTDVKLGGNVSVAAGPVGAGATAATADVLAFSRAKGLYAGITLEGAVVDVLDSWNKDFYGSDVRPADILLHGTATSPAAEPLRQAVAGMAR